MPCKFIDFGVPLAVPPLNSALSGFEHTVNVRAACEADVLGIATVHVQSWKRAYAGVMPPELLDGLDPTQRSQDWTEELQRDRGEALVAVENGKVVGFSYFSVSRDEDAGDRTGEVQAIYVEPSRWRHGIGRELLEESLSRLRARGFEKVSLWVLERNDSACRFYSSMGFSQDGARKIHPPTGLAEVRYLRSLN